MSDVDKWYREYWARHRARNVMYQTLKARCVSSEDRAELNKYEQVIFDRTRHAARLRFFAMRVLCYLLSVDYAQDIVVIGRKKAPAEKNAQPA